MKHSVISGADLSSLFRCRLAALCFRGYRYGEIESIRVLHERFCAFINFKNANMAAKALERLQVGERKAHFESFHHVKRCSILEVHSFESQ